MKKLALSVVMVCGLLVQAATAQVKFNLDINLGSQPVWGPPGYDHAEYYYLPDYDVYYDVPRQQYIYWQGNRRVVAASLPAKYRSVDLYKSYKVVINEPKAYLHHADHVKKYAEFRGRHDQPVIRDNHEEKYWQVKGHPDHAKWKGGHDKDKDHGHGHH